MNLELLASLFEENFTSLGELGASASVWQDGAELLTLAAGLRDREKTVPFTANTPVLIWSATKALSAACLLHACQENNIPLERKVSTIWPEFGAAGKSDVTLAQLLSHQAGLPALSKEVPVVDYDAVVEALAEQPPHWPLGEGHGYHPRTFGFLLDELVRRITGAPSLGSYWRKIFAEPLQLDLWIGLEPDQSVEVAPVFPARRAPPPGDPFYSAFLTADSLTSRAFTSPRGLNSVASMNAAEVRTLSFPAFGGTGTAHSLAKFYSMLAQGGDGWFRPETIASMRTTLSQGHDRVLQMETAFSAGFMRDPFGTDGLKIRESFGPSHGAFGHPGAGGSVAFADPENRLSFAYVMNQMEPGVLPNPKSLRLISALYGS